MQRNIRVDILVPTPLSGPYIWLGYVTCERSSISGGGGGGGGNKIPLWKMFGLLKYRKFPVRAKKS